MTVTISIPFKDGLQFPCIRVVILINLSIFRPISLVGSLVIGELGVMACYILQPVSLLCTPFSPCPIRELEANGGTATSYGDIDYTIIGFHKTRQNYRTNLDVKNGLDKQQGSGKTTR